MKAFFLSLFILVSGCHGAESEVEFNPLPVLPAVKVTVDVFGSYTCGICNEELPGLHERMVRFNQGRLNKVTVRLFVVNGKGNANVTQNIADQYAKDLGLTTFTAYPDNKCRGQYQAYYPNQGCYVPAHVLIEGSDLKIYPQGRVNLDKFMADVKAAVGE